MDKLQRLARYTPPIFLFEAACCLAVLAHSLAPLAMLGILAVLQATISESSLHVVVRFFYLLVGAAVAALAIHAFTAGLVLFGFANVFLGLACFGLAVTRPAS
jgi:hypothetical protein